MPKLIKRKINFDLKKIKSKKKNFSNLNFKKIPNLLGVLNLTPDSFSDGGQFNTTLKAIKHAKHLLNAGADLIDVGGEINNKLLLIILGVDQLAPSFE